jgi:hypothetical protein
MKVPNQILHIIVKLVDGTKDITEAERVAVRHWALSGIAKREALVHPDPKSEE